MTRRSEPSRCCTQPAGRLRTGDFADALEPPRPGARPRSVRLRRSPSSRRWPNNSEPSPKPAPSAAPIPRSSRRRGGAAGAARTGGRIGSWPTRCSSSRTIPKRWRYRRRSVRSGQSAAPRRQPRAAAPQSSSTRTADAAPGPIRHRARRRASPGVAAGSGERRERFA